MVFQQPTKHCKMKIETYKEGIRYTLSNENLQEGDKVFPIANGRCLEDGGWILHSIEFDSPHTGRNTSGFPDDPHTILNLKNSDYKPYEVSTDKGFSPAERYFKIVKKEKQVVNKTETKNFIFRQTKWVEI